LRLLREQLTALGQSIGDEDFTAIILSSLPTSYDSNIAAMTSSALISQKDLKSDFIMKILLNEYDRCKIRSKKTTSGTTEDAAYSAKDKKSTTCENCGKKGHAKDQCWQEGGGRAGKAPKWFKGKKKDTEPDGVWLAQADDLDLDEEAFTRTYNHALLAGAGLDNHEEMILFNSGASRHMSSYHSQFLDYKPIVPKPITAADNHTFLAIGKGDL
ncbi:hypothetical protein PISMIDRAFT_48262, partial [Pisolithus microcarpus 441]